MPGAFLIFFFSICRMFLVFSACLIPSFTRCRHVERSSTMRSQLSMSMAADFICLLQNIFEVKKWAASFMCTLLSSLLRSSFGILPFLILHVCPSHLRCLWLSRACMLEQLAFSSTVVFGILSCQAIHALLSQRRFRWLGDMPDGKRKDSKGPPLR